MGQALFSLELSAPTYFDTGYTPEFNSLPVVAEVVPQSPGLEIITAKDVFSSMGQKLNADSSGVNLRYLAVVDLNRDGSNEIIALQDGSMRVLSGLQTEVCRKVLSTDLNFPLELTSVPTTGDFDGDGKFEIIENAGLSAVSIQSGLSNDIFWSSGSIADELNSFQPIVVNVDDTLAAEIVKLSLSVVSAFHEPSSLWMGTRRVWNQLSYSPKLTTDSLSLVKKPDSARIGFHLNPAFESAPMCK